MTKRTNTAHSGADASDDASPPKRGKLKLSARQRKQKARRGLIRVDADRPLIPQARAHANRY